MANATYNRGLFKLAEYYWDTDAVNIGVLLVENTYVFDRTHNTVTDVSGDEAAGGTYARKPIAAAQRSINEDDVGNAANLRVTDGTVAWLTLNCGVDLRVVLFFVDATGGINDDDCNLLGYIDTGTNIPINTNGGDVTLNFSTDGAVKYS